MRGYTYDEAIVAPAADQDPLEYFLFEIQRGYCDYYASAMAVMLRSLGIPARTVSGYAEGLYDEESGIYVITERDAHTWVEVYFPGYGWIEFEPTAGESALERPSGADLPEPSSIPGAPDEINNPQSDEDFGGIQDLPPEFPEGAAPDTAFRPSTQWMVVTVLLTLAALAGGWWLMRRRVWQGPDGFVLDPPLLVYARLIGWAQRLRLATQSGLTPYERSAILTQELPLGAPFIQRITDIYVRFRFAPRSANTAKSESELESNWQQLRPVLLRAWLQQRLRQPRQSAKTRS